MVSPHRAASLPSRRRAPRRGRRPRVRRHRGAGAPPSPGPGPGAASRRRAEGRDHRGAALARRALDDGKPHLRCDLAPLRATLHAGRAVRRGPDAGRGPCGVGRRQDLDDPPPPRRAVSQRQGVLRRGRGGVRRALGTGRQRGQGPVQERPELPGEGSLHRRAPVRRLRGARARRARERESVPGDLPEGGRGRGGGRTDQGVHRNRPLPLRRADPRSVHAHGALRQVRRPRRGHQRLRRSARSPTWTSSSSFPFRTCRSGRPAWSPASSTSATGSPPTTTSG